MRAFLAAGTLASLALPATAAEPVEYHRELPYSWTVFGKGGEATAGGCMTSSEWEHTGRGDTKLTVLQRTDADSVYVTVTNSDWTATEGSLYSDIRLVLNGQSYSGGTALGTKSDAIYKGFTTIVPSKFLDDFRSATSISVYREDKVASHLNLVGSGAAIASFKTCIKRVAAADAAYRRVVERSSYITKDPFASPAPSASGSNAEISGAITRPDWLSRPDAADLDRYYPERAKEEGVNGRATISCRLTARGTLTACSVVSETPAGFGFGQATIRAAGRFRARPQTVDGKPVEGGTIQVPLVWRTGE